HTLSAPQARAFGFTTLIASNLALIFSNRSRRHSIIQTLRTPNSMLWIVTTSAVGLLALALYLPFLTEVFHFAVLPIAQTTLAFGIGMASVIWIEGFKLIRRHRAMRQRHP
ncbi:MAG: cation-translocating P-type ATPase C-terminal domain-containing protein, partial [Herbaspirillum sp.]